jgi:hypothetical protein
MQKVVIEETGSYLVTTRIDGGLIFISSGGRSRPTKRLKAARVYSSYKRAAQGARAFGIRRGIELDKFYIHPAKVSYAPSIRTTPEG